MASIRPVALCLVEHEGKFLLQDSDFAGVRLLRPPGGGIDFGEHAAEAVRREMQEEIGSDIGEIELLAVLENPFKFKHLGAHHHEIVFLFRARLLDEHLYTLEEMPLTDNGVVRRAAWFSKEQLLGGGDWMLEPAGMLTLITQMTLISSISL